MERIAVIMGKMHSGGKKNLVMEYYRHIDRKIIQFDFICDEDSNSIPVDEIEKMGGRVYIVAPYQNIIKNMIQMRNIFLRNNYRIMHSYNGTMNLFSLLVGWICHIPIRISESISMSHSSDKKNIIKRILKPFSRMFATHYMANGEICGRWQFGDKLFDTGKVKIFKTVINTETNRYDEINRRVTRKKYEIESNITFGHIGRLTAQKNTLFIIDIFFEILKKDPMAILLIIGDGNLKDEMFRKIKEYKIQDHVLYLGRREDIIQFYNAMDGFLLPSLYEGLPVVGVEAECFGLPVFFSTEIPLESSPCEDLGVFISLEKNAEEWADIALQVTKKNMLNRKGREREVKEAGFDSNIEANKLARYYIELLNNLDNNK